MSTEHKGWYSRGFLPHLDQPGLIQALTFRLHDSVPLFVIQQWKEELYWRDNLPNDAQTARILHQRIAKYEDAGYGDCWLRDERIAVVVENTFLHFDGQRYRLIAWCIMPNHVHILVDISPDWRLDQVLQSWKSFTAHQANKILNRNGPFWAREYHDRYIRSDEHLAQAVAYIENNPVKAGLVQSAQEWKFSSAARRQ